MKIPSKAITSEVSQVRDNAPKFSSLRISALIMLLSIFFCAICTNASADDFIEELMMGDMFYAADDYFGEDADIAHVDNAVPQKDEQPAETSDNNAATNNNDDRDDDDDDDEDDNNDPPPPVDPPIYIPPPGGG